MALDCCWRCCCSTELTSAESLATAAAAAELATAQKADTVALPAQAWGCQVCSKKVATALLQATAAGEQATVLLRATALVLAAVLRSQVE